MGKRRQRDNNKHKASEGTSMQVPKVKEAGREISTASTGMLRTIISISQILTH